MVTLLSRLSSMSPGMLAVATLFAIALVILHFIANWKVFEKAGEPGWKCLIPFYNTYTHYKITWKTSMFWTWLGLGLCRSLISPLASSGAVLLLPIFFVIAIAELVIGLIQTHKLSKAFGYGGSFTVGLIFLPTVFILILAFGDHQYLGPDR